MRKVEEMVKDINEGNTVSQSARHAKAAGVLPKELQTMQTSLSKKLGAKVQMKYSEGKGRITIPFASQQEMERILKVLGKLK